MKAVIFDFNRTIFDPEGGKLIPGVKKVLRELKRKKILLILVSQKERGRELLIDKTGIGAYFSEIIYTDKKTTTLFRRIVKRYGLEVQKSFVVGDRVRGEILIGNLCGFKTIWIQRGKFAKELPKNGDETPKFKFKRITEILKVVR